MAIAARLLAKGTIPQKGIVAPEEAVVGKVHADFMIELEKRGIHVKEVRQKIQPGQPDRECYREMLAVHAESRTRRGTQIAHLAWIARK